MNSRGADQRRGHFSASIYFRIFRTSLFCKTILIANTDPGSGKEVMDWPPKGIGTRERGIHIDAVTGSDLVMPTREASPITMEDLDRIIGTPDLMPPGTEVQPMGNQEYGLLAPGMTERLRVTTDPVYFEEHAESLELWSPGNALFVPPEFTVNAETTPSERTLKDILDG